MSIPTQPEQVWEKALKQIACEHDPAGGNDYLACRKCGLEWDYRWMDKPTPAMIARLALEYGWLWSINVPRAVHAALQEKRDEFKDMDVYARPQESRH